MSDLSKKTLGIADVLYSEGTELEEEMLICILECIKPEICPCPSRSCYYCYPLPLKPPGNWHRGKRCFKFQVISQGCQYEMPACPRRKPEAEGVISDFHSEMPAAQDDSEELLMGLD